VNIAVHYPKKEKPPRRNKIQRVDRPTYIKIDASRIKENRKFKQVLEIV